MEGETLTIAGAIDDDLVAGMGQAIKGAVAEDRIIKQSQPLIYRPVTGDNEAGVAMPGDDHLMRVGRQLGSELLQAEIVQDDQGGGSEGTKGLLQVWSILDCANV